MKKSIPTIWEREGNEKTHSHNWEREGNEKKAFPKFGNRKGMKKSIPITRERESEAFILGNGREREFPLTPEGWCQLQHSQLLNFYHTYQLDVTYVDKIHSVHIWSNLRSLRTCLTDGITSSEASNNSWKAGIGQQMTQTSMLLRLTHHCLITTVPLFRSLDIMPGDISGQCHRPTI